MDPNVKLHLGKYRRYLWEDPNILVTLGDLSEVLTSRTLYEERHKIPPVSTGDKDLKMIMGAAALSAASLAERESWGWTLTFPDSELGFFCGIEPEGMICGRVRPAPAERSTVYLQRQKGSAPMTQSHYEPDPTGPVETIERYFEVAAQIQTRIALDENGSGVLVQALPNARFSEVAQLPKDKLITLCRQMASRGELKPIQEVLMFYECRCTDEMILDMITTLPDSQRKELWGDESELKIECPRCSREYTLQRQS